jgi:hypothetical protein
MDLRSIRILENCQRHEIVSLLEGRDNVGVELGVAEGTFSERMVRSGRFRRFIGIDIYSDPGHDTQQYKRALRRVGLLSGYTLLRMHFADALDLFDDQSLDFVYVDGYAHGGEDGGETIFDWYSKVRVGGILAGDDYHPDWPLVQSAVNEFIARSGEELMLTGKTEVDDAYSLYPTWCVRKSRHQRITAPAEMIRRGKAENDRVRRARGGGWVRTLAPWFVPGPILTRAARWLGRMETKK